MALPENWQLAEEYNGNFIYEDNEMEFQVVIDKLPNFTPPYSISFLQLKGTFIKIGFESGAYSTHAYDETDAKRRAQEMMNFINSKFFFNHKTSFD